MQIPNFIDLKKYMEPEERQALVLLLDAAVGRKMAQVRLRNGTVQNGYLNIRLPQKVVDAFDELSKRIR